MSTTLSRVPESARSDPARKPPRVTVLRILLACGVVYPLLYFVAADGIAATLNDGYSRMDQAVSELSGTAAPTRRFLTAMLPVYAVLMIAFGIGVRKSAEGTRALRVTGNLFIAWAIVGTALAAIPDELTPGCRQGRAHVGERHRPSRHERLDARVHHVGVVVWCESVRKRVPPLLDSHRRHRARLRRLLMSTQAPNVPDPTPWMGLYERVMMWAWFLWIAVLAIILLRRATETALRKTSPSGHSDLTTVGPGESNVEAHGAQRAGAAATRGVVDAGGPR